MDSKLLEIRDLPYTISYVIRKLAQVDNLNEIGKEKRPSDEQIWEDPTEDLEKWLDEIFEGKIQKELTFEIRESDIE